MKNLRFKFFGILFLIIFLFQISFASEKEKICPFELISFTAEAIEDTAYGIAIVNLEWKTASEMYTDKFIIERDTLPVPVFWLQDNFCPIGEHTAAGNSTTTKTYNFSDTVGFGIFAYRIKGVDKDGSFSYSDEIIVSNYTDVEEKIFSNSLIEDIYPNPSPGKFNILLNSKYLGHSELNILNVIGEKLKTLNVESSKDLINIDLSEFPSGDYYLNVSRGTFYEIRKIVIIK